MQGCWSKFIGNGGHHWPPSLLHAPQGLPGTLLTEVLRNLSVRGHLHSRESPCGCSQEARCNGGDARGRAQMGDVGMRTSGSIDPQTQDGHTVFFRRKEVLIRLSQEIFSWLIHHGVIRNEIGEQ